MATEFTGYDGGAVADLVVAESSSYWRSVARSVAVSVAVCLGVALTIVLTLLPLRVTFRFGISGGAGLAALGVLGTIVVALQVAVRSVPDAPADTHELARVVARQRGLEAFARICSVAAIAVAGAVVTGYWPNGSGAWNLAALFGSVAGALLVAGLAADASIATEKQWDGAVRRANELALIAERERALQRLDSGSVNEGFSVAVVRAVSWCVGAPLFVASVSKMFLSSSLTVLLFSTSMILFVSVYTLMLVTRYGVLTRQPLVWGTGLVYLLALFGVVAVPLYRTADTLKAPAWVGLLMVVAVLWVPIFGAMVAMTRVGVRRGSGAVLITRFLQWRLRQLRGEDPHRRRGGRRGFKSKAWIFSAVAPLIAFPVAQFHLTRTRIRLYGSVPGRCTGALAPLDPSVVAELTQSERLWSRSVAVSIVAVPVQVVLGVAAIVIRTVAG